MKCKCSALPYGSGVEARFGLPLETAYKIEDNGDDYGGGRYLYCSSENKKLSVNSKSFEILSLTVD